MPEEPVAPVEAGTEKVDQLAQRPPDLRLRLLAVALAMLGGLLGVLGAIVQELTGGGGIGVFFVGAPIIEEALKPAGIYVLLLRWPNAVEGRLTTGSLTALSGLVFGLIESLIYVTLYFPDGTSDFVLYRFTVTPLMHTGASFLVGLGLSRAVIDWAAGRAAFPKRTRNFYIAAVLVHAVYNTSALMLSLIGVLDID